MQKRGRVGRIVVSEDILKYQEKRRFSAARLVTQLTSQSENTSVLSGLFCWFHINHQHLNYYRTPLNLELRCKLRLAKKHSPKLKSCVLSSFSKIEQKILGQISSQETYQTKRSYRSNDIPSKSWRKRKKTLTYSRTFFVFIALYDE